METSVFCLRGHWPNINHVTIPCKPLQGMFAGCIPGYELASNYYWCPGPFGRRTKQAASPIPSSFNLASISNLVPIFHISTTANLLDEHISAAISHIIKLCLPVHTQDTLPKVLIIGDLNARKSMLLPCQIMPVN